MDMKKVSIIMPCHNDGKYIGEAIRSVMGQTYPDWELIIVDDGSDDPETAQALEGLQDARVRVFHTPHLRPAGARNYGISQAEGEYILPLDSDDRIEGTYIEKAVSVLEGDPGIGIVYCRADLFGEEEGPWGLPDYSFRSMLLDNIVFVTALFYKSDWEKVGGFSTTMEAGMEDYDFWLSVMALGKGIHQIPEVLFHYRIKPSSRTASFQSSCEQVQATYRQIYRNHRDFYREHYDEYALVLRDALIEQIFLRRKYEERWRRFSRLTSTPVLGAVLRKVLKEG